MRRQAFFILLFLLLFASCNNNGSGDGPFKPEGIVTLENQEEHSGITIEILEADTFVFTDSSGYYELPPLEDGTYTLNIIFPYYWNERLSVSILEGSVSTPIPTVELTQVLEFHTNINDTIFELTDTINLSCSAVNISDFTLPVHWGMTPPWTVLLFYEGTLIDSQIPQWAALVFDTINPNDSLIFSSYWLLASSYFPGNYEIIPGVVTLVFNQEIIPVSTYFGSFGIHEKVYSKIPRKYFRIIE